MTLRRRECRLLAKNIIFLLWMIMLSCSSKAENVPLADMMSPKLRQFLADYPSALEALSNAVSESTSCQNLRLYYFYSSDESVPRAYHHYTGESGVTIVIRENQQPCDEWIWFLFEVLNSRGEKRFMQLGDMARAGTISKTDFPREVLRQEFQAVKMTKALIRTVHLSRQEEEESYCFNRFVECPDDFEEFLSYKKRVSPGRDQINEYEREYEVLRQSGHGP